jgi:hypothetical protein
MYSGQFKFPSNLRQRLHVVNFGSPRVGNKAFASLVASLRLPTVYRIVNSWDIVTQTPPASFGYEHYPMEIWIRDGDYFLCHQPQLNSIPQTLARSNGILSKLLKSYFKWKNMENPYCSVSVNFFDLTGKDHGVYTETITSSKCLCPS